MCLAYVCVVVKSYLYVVVSCIGSLCVCAMFENKGSLLGRIHYCHGRTDA